MERTASNERRRGLLAAVLLLAPLLLAACAEVEPDDYDGLVAPPHPTYFTVVVRPGDSLASIGARYDVAVPTLEHMNNIDRQRDVRPGEVLRIPAASRRTREAVFHDATTGPYRETHAVASADLPPPPPRPVRYAHDGAPPPPGPVRVARDDMPPPVSQRGHDRAPPDQPQDMPVSYGDGHFVWPLTGQVISTFGSFGNGQRNDGINIAARLGEPIHAAAGGTVTYVGNELKGYGNLILIRHDDGYVTAYAHAESISVNRGDRVEKGQVIGLAGETGDVSSPQLHFEIRRGVEPVDPKPLLMADRAS